MDSDMRYLSIDDRDTVGLCDWKPTTIILSHLPFVLVILSDLLPRASSISWSIGENETRRMAGLPGNVSTEEP